MDRRQVMEKLEKTWQDFIESFAGLSDADMTEPRVAGEWSVKDLVAHVTTWEEETLKALPLLIEGKRTPLYHGIDRFNAEQSARKRDLTLDVVLDEAWETHRRLLTYLGTVPGAFFTRETRVRRRLRLDTYHHYPEHAASIRAWRKTTGAWGKRQGFRRPS